MAKDSRFDRGTVIVVEAWGRLGRLRPDRQVELVAELLRTGVQIGVCRLGDIFAEEDFGSHKWTTLAVFIQLAYQESRQKSERLASSWASRRARAQSEGRPTTTQVPEWLAVRGGKVTGIPERVAAVRRIFQLAAGGLGHARIIRQLVAEGVAPFGERSIAEGRTRSRLSGRWTKSYV